MKGPRGAGSRRPLRPVRTAGDARPRDGPPELTVIRGGTAGPVGGRALPPPRSSGPRLLLLLALLLAAASGLAFWRATRPPPASAPAMAAIRQGALLLDWTGEMVLVRSEQVHVSPVSGQARRLATEGQPVRVGTPVVAVRSGPGAETVVAAEESGIVSYGLDGLETHLAPTALPWLEGGEAAAPGPEWMASLPSSRPDPDSQWVAGGTPVFKVLDATRTWLVAAVPADVLPARLPGDSLRLLLPQGGAEVPVALTYRSDPVGGTVLLALRATRPLPIAALLARWLRAQIVFDQVTGWIVPERALVPTGEGGYLVRVQGPRGEERAEPVEVLARRGAYVALAGNLETEDRVVLPGTSSQP